MSDRLYDETYIERVEYLIALMKEEVENARAHIGQQRRPIKDHPFLLQVSDLAAVTRPSLKVVE